MSCELHIETRGDRRPDPEFDSICALFYAITNDIPKEKGPRERSGVIVLDPESSRHQKQFGGSFDPDQASTSKAANERNARLLAAGSHPASANETAAKEKSFQTLLQRSGVTDIDVTYVASEAELLDKLVELVNRWALILTIISS
ncbi:hypothetical protein NP493_337g00014 [Ridgeia piscesae]|uniref:Uncharacterized protein n=1 Tax=Ridgeia piscesae TaxID=27915 RepID=A0AAD9L4I8_RIDPI|nr:hypothetical protein NP493_337g00014 [Ridgeia piscesae]